MIKILTKKQWIELNKVIEELQNTVSEKRYSNLTHTIEDLQESKRKLASAKGGLNAKIKRLENKIKHLEELQTEASSNQEAGN